MVLPAMLQLLHGALALVRLLYDTYPKKRVEYIPFDDYLFKVISVLNSACPFPTFRYETYYSLLYASYSGSYHHGCLQQHMPIPASRELEQATNATLTTFYTTTS